LTDRQNRQKTELNYIRRQKNIKIQRFTLHRAIPKIYLAMSRIQKIALVTLSFLQITTANAKVIQILHTNDLHASLKASGAAAEGKEATGGWAQIKSTMDGLTESAKLQQIETIRLDAGDFFEGTLSYFPDHGANVLKAFQSMGYDAVALGNHDWLMGARNTNRAFGKTPFPFPLLSANTELSSELSNLKKQIIPSTQIIRSGLRIGVMGLSTDEMFYKWITKVESKSSDMNIRKYHDVKDSNTGETIPGIANRLALDLSEKNDLVIALTHIGFKEDKKLAESSSNIDLIVGGHSHTLLESLSIVENKLGVPVPIVQTGSTGAFIGKILVDVIPGKRPQVLTYELIPVSNQAPSDPVVANHIDNSEKRLESLYGSNTLNQVVGQSEARLISGSGGETAYSRFIVDAMKDASGADLALDIGEFHSNSPQAGGDITIRKLMEMYPRKLNASQNEGLYVYQFSIPGWMLKIALKLAVKFGYPLSLSGVNYKTASISDAQYGTEKEKLGDNWKAKALTRYRLQDSSIQINGKPLKYFKQYKVATPEFVVRGAYAISFLTKLVVRWGKPTKHTIWDASANYLSKIKVIRDQTGYKQSTVFQGDYTYSRELLEELLRSISTDANLTE
jgi:5'-nucleotidase